ncbi:MAG: hypothetical protein U9N36_11420 [Euryarchaeota archaeon]|nr:hypothetical protein [Euryarchaeota archaeon]
MAIIKKQIQPPNVYVMVEVKFKRRKYKGKRTTVIKLFRVVAVLNKETGDYHIYMTNIPVEKTV